MGWTLNYLVPKEPEYLDKFFLVIGKALYIATSFESKCQYVLRIAKLATHYETTGDASATMTLAEAMKDLLLGQTINNMKVLRYFTANDVAILERAKDARNFIAHESADMGFLSSISTELINEKLSRLRRELEALVAGDNLVSKWIYAIEEKEPAPREILNCMKTDLI